MNVIELLKEKMDSLSTICAKYINENDEIEYLPIFYIAGSQTLPPPLETKEEEELIKKLSEEDNLQTRQILVERNLRLVVYIAKKFENTGIGIEDLISIGTIGLMKGVNTFNSGKNIKLATYASRCIENEILMYFRSNKKYNNNVSLNDSIGYDKDGNEISLIDVIKDEGENFDDIIHDKDIKSRLSNYLHVLNEREKLIIIKRYGLGDENEYTQKEISESLGISRSYVSRIEKRALLKLFREFKKDKQIL